MKIRLGILLLFFAGFYACKKNSVNNPPKKAASDTTVTNNPKDTVVTNNPKDTTAVTPIDSTKIFKASITERQDSVGGDFPIYIEKATTEPSSFKVIFNNAETLPSPVYGPGLVGYIIKVPQGAITGPVYVSINDQRVKVLDTFYVVKTKFEWKRLKPFPGGKRTNGVAFVVDNRGYFGTGENPEIPQYFRDMWQYQEDSDTWLKKSDLPLGANNRYLARTNGFSFVYQNRPFVGGGSNTGYGEPIGDINEYNAATDTWIPRIFMTQDKFGISSAVFLNDVAYIFGSGNNRVAYKYHPSYNYIEKLYSGQGFNYYGAINNMIVAGDNGHVIDLFGKDVVKDHLNSLLVAPPADYGVFKATVTYRGELYMSFGDQGYLWKLNLTTKKWTVVAHKQMRVFRGTTTFLLGSKLYAVGGMTDVKGSATDDVWMIDLDRYVRY